VDGFRITGGNADGANGLGSGISSQNARLALANSAILNNSGSSAGSALLMACVGLTVSDLTLGANATGLSGALSDNILVLNGLLRLSTGTLEVQSSTLEGSGAIDLAEGTLMRIGGGAMAGQMAFIE